ncbi:MAG: response regulator [Chloroflexi bacterium]|nr:response regulator [Chloroflexota bacterium]
MDQPADVLVIDDEEDARLIVKLALEKAMGLTVEEAFNGEEGLEIVRARPPRLIILDLTMPGMNGAEFLAQLRSEPDIAHIPVIVFTARFITEELADQIGVPSYAILRKGSLRVEQLRSVVQDILA